MIADVPRHVNKTNDVHQTITTAEPITRVTASSLLKKWKERVRSKFSVNVSREKDVVLPKIGPDPDIFNRLLGVLFAPSEFGGDHQSTLPRHQMPP